LASLTSEAPLLQTDVGCQIKTGVINTLQEPLNSVGLAFAIVSGLPVYANLLSNAANGLQQVPVHASKTRD